MGVGEWLAQRGRGFVLCLIGLAALSVALPGRVEAMEAACGWCDESRAKAEGYLARVEASLAALEAQWAASREALGEVARRRMDELVAVLADQRDAIRAMLKSEGEAWTAVIEVRAAELAVAVDAAGAELRAVLAGGGQQIGAALDRLATGTRAPVRRLFVEARRSLGALDPIDGRLMASVEAAERSMWARGLAIGVAAVGVLLLGVGIPSLRRARWLLGVPLAVLGIAAMGAGWWLYLPRGEVAAVVGVEDCPVIVEARQRMAGPLTVEERQRLRTGLAQCRVQAADPVLAEWALDVSRKIINMNSTQENGP